MPYSLKGRNVLVTGGSRGLGEQICLKFASEKCNAVAINYVSSVERAAALAAKIEKDYGVKAVIVQGDMGIEADCVRTVQESIAKLGGLDILISNAGYTKFSVFSDLNAPTTEDWDMCYAVNVKAQVFLLREALKTFELNPEGGVFIMTSSIAGKNVSGSSMPYSVTKAAQLHLMRCLAKASAPKTRVNACLPGWLDTEWGIKYSTEAIEAMKERSLLKKETDLDDTAQTFVDIARNSSMTGQQIQVDSGLGQN